MNLPSRQRRPPAPATDLRYTVRKSGGRKPPVVPINADVTAIHTRTHTVGGLPNNRARVYANVFPSPRRAHARRSFSACVCASKKPFFAGRQSHRNTRAGGVSSPWETKRAADGVHLRRPAVCGTRYARAGGVSPPVVPLHANATAIRTYTVGGPPNNRARVYANVFPSPRRAHARRSFSACVCASKKPFFAGEHSHRNTRAGGR